MLISSQFLLFGNYPTKKCLLAGVKESPYLCGVIQKSHREDAHARHN